MAHGTFWDVYKHPKQLDEHLVGVFKSKITSLWLLELIRHSWPRLRGFVSQADGRLLCWIYRVWVMLLAAAVVVLATAPRPPWLYLRAKWKNRMQEGNALARRRETRVRVLGLNPGAGKWFFSWNLCKDVLVQLLCCHGMSVLNNFEWCNALIV